jgi:hypothetical protein
MRQPLTFEQRFERMERSRVYNKILDLDVRSFRLHYRLRRLERRWPGKTADEQRSLRLQRMKIRADFEMIKIDLEKVEREVAKVFR